MRRALLRALLGSPLMAGDQLRRPLNAPPSGQGAPVGTQPGVTNPGFFQRVIVFGPGGQPVGVFVYSGTPAAGNPPIAWLSNSGTDPYGNALPAAIVGTESGGTFAGFGAGGQIILNAGNFSAAVIVALSDVLQLTSPAASGVDVQAIAQLQSAAVLGVPMLTLSGTGIRSAGGTPAVPSVVQTDVWNNMALNAGFAAGVPAPQFKLMADQTVMCRGIVALSANQAANTVFATLGANYVSAHGTQFVTRNTLSGYALGNGSVANAGGASTLAIVVAGVNGNVVELDGVRYSTDT